MALSDREPSAPTEVLVISWVDWHGRSAGLAAVLGGTALFMPWARPRRGLARAVLSWLRSAVATWRAVRRLSRGSIVVTMAPPVFAPLCVLAASRGRSLRLVLDAHSGVFNDPRWSWSRRLVSWVAAHHQLLLVTNEDVLEGADVDAPRVAVLHDPLERAPASPVPEGPRYALFPASGAPDEPLAELSAAAALLAEVGVEVRVTGRVGSRLPHLAFTGHVDRPSYEALLRGASVVLALTTRDGTMQRAAYEALEVGRPIVASESAALRHALDSAARYVTNEPADIARGVREALEASDELVAAGRAVVATMSAQAQRVAETIRSL